MIVFEGDYVLQECLEQVYPYAEQILIAEGPVEYWQRRGRTTSTDRTNEILENAKKITNSVNFGAIFNKKIKVLVTNEKRKTLHSIRHFVATKLKKKITNDSMIKTILGHAENDTLNNIYAKEGYSLQQINETIQLL